MTKYKKEEPRIKNQKYEDFTIECFLHYVILNAETLKDYDMAQVPAGLVDNIINYARRAWDLVPSEPVICSISSEDIDTLHILRADTIKYVPPKEFEIDKNTCCHCRCCSEFMGICHHCGEDYSTKGEENEST